MEALVVLGDSHKMLLSTLAEVDSQDRSDAIFIALPDKLKAAGGAIDICERECAELMGFGPVDKLVDG